MKGLGQRSFWTRGLLIIIMGVFLLTVPACGKKGDPIPPQTQQPKTGAATEQQPKAGTGAEQPQQQKTGASPEQPQQPNTGTSPDQPGVQPGATPGK